MRVVVTLCTRERPKLLRACLVSLLGQAVPDSVFFAIVVVENDATPSSATIIAELTETSTVPLTYVHEPRLGIPIARNRAIAAALQYDPEWIGFIDDDEVASSNWIAHFLRAAASVEGDVFQGPVEYLHEGAGPTWMPLPRRKHAPTGRPLRTAATSNTFMRAHIARSDGLALRFNEAMRFTGGSDNEYFYRAADRGARICWMDDAVVLETVPENRTTLTWHLSRAARVAANSVSIQKNRLGLTRAIAKCAPKYLARVIGGAGVLPFVVILSALGLAAVKRLTVSSLCKIASGMGGLAAFFSYQPQPYGKNAESDSRIFGGRSEKQGSTL